MSFERESERLLDLLFTAPGDLAGWQCFLDEFALFIKAGVVTYVTFDAAHDAYTINCMSDIDPAFPKLYRDRYAAMDEWYLRAKRRVTAGYVNDGRTLCPTKELVNTEFYNEFLRPFGFIHECAAVLDLTATSIHALTLLRSSTEPEFSTEDLDVVRAFIPHIKRAAHLHRRFLDLKASSSANEWLMDQVNFGVVLLRSDGTVLLANKLAEQLCSGDGLQLTARGLRTTGYQDPDVKSLFDCFKRLELGSITPGTLVIRRRDGAALLLTFGPIPQSMAGGAQRATAVFIHDPSRRPTSKIGILSRLYGLTPAEVRLAELLARGMSIAEASEMLQLSRNTVKTQAKAIYSKTGSRTQTQLALLGVGFQQTGRFDSH